MTYRTDTPDPLALARMSPEQVASLPNSPTRFWSICDYCGRQLHRTGAATEHGAAMLALAAGAIMQQAKALTWDFVTASDVCEGGNLFCARCYRAEFQ
jgi:hypothetical protein